MGNSYDFYKIPQAFIDGFFTGADLIGTVIGHVTGDTRHRGYQADKFGLIVTRRRAEVVCGVNSHGMEEWTERIKERGLAERVVKTAGNLSGLSVNILSLGLLNTMFLGEVYCREK